jgi:hypothetical protein
MRVCRLCADAGLLALIVNGSRVVVSECWIATAEEMAIYGANRLFIPVAIEKSTFSL